MSGGRSAARPTVAKTIRRSGQDRTAARTEVPPRRPLVPSVPTVPVVSVESVTDGQIKVFLLDDHEVVREGIRALLESEPDIDVIGEGATATQALARVPALRPDVAILDVRLPDGDGVTVCRDLRAQLPDLACVMLTSYADDDALLQAVMAGASGYLLKDVRATGIIDAIRTVARGKSLLDPTATARLLDRLRQDAAHKDPLAALTGQEHQVLELIGEGLTNRQIGQRLFLAEKTVKNYISSIFMKLGLQRRTQAAILATQLRLDHEQKPGA
jgi:DNA-binding NarL/FixJ family response regulator